MASSLDWVIREAAEKMPGHALLSLDEICKNTAQVTFLQCCQLLKYRKCTLCCDWPILTSKYVISQDSMRQCRNFPPYFICVKRSKERNMYALGISRLLRLGAIGIRDVRAKSYRDTGSCWGNRRDTGYCEKTVSGTCISSWEIRDTTGYQLSPKSNGIRDTGYWIRDTGYRIGGKGTKKCLIYIAFIASN